MNRAGLPWLVARDLDASTYGAEARLNTHSLRDPIEVARAIATAAADVARHSTTSAVASAIIDQVRALGAHVTMLFSADDSRRELSILAHAGVPSRLLESVQRVSYDTPLLTTFVARSHCIETIPDADAVPPTHALIRELLVTTSSRSVIATPLLIRGKLIGVLSWSLREVHAFSPAEMQAMAAIGDVFALALENARRFEEERRLRHELEVSEIKWRTVCDSSLDLIVVLSPARIVLAINDAALMTTGTRRHEILGFPFDRTPWAALLGESRAEVLRSIDDALRGATSRRSLTIQGVDGQPRHLDMLVSPITEVAGRLDVIVIQSRDMTAERNAAMERDQLVQQLEVERARLHTILDHAPCALVLIESVPSERMYANPAAERLLGITFDSSFGREQYLGGVRHLDGTPVPFEALVSTRALRGEIVAPEEILIRHADGTEIAVLESATPVRDGSGNIVGAVIASEDLGPLRDLDRLRKG